MHTGRKGAYGADDDIVDFILGITFEIWEEGGVELIHQYYADDCIVYGLDGIVRGAAEMVAGTRATLAGFPDRLLLAENVIWSGDRAQGYYTSHRLLSLATNKGRTIYGPPTGVRIRMTNIADCVVEDGVIVREWLVRDNMTLASQLGAEPVAAARGMAERSTAEFRGIEPVYHGIMGIDATWKESYPKPLVMDQEVVRKVDSQWSRYWK